MRKPVRPKSNSSIDDRNCAIYVDLGTTNTRVWLMRGKRIVAKGSVAVGVRDTAREGSPAGLRAGLRELIATVRRDSGSAAPLCVAAAGMITSSLGLAELDHVPAPVGLHDLAAAARWFQFPDVTDLPFLFIPGVRCGSRISGKRQPTYRDLIRGEETLCLGLLVLGMLEPPGLVLSLGSHWKAIQISRAGAIERSVTTLSGELIHAAQTQTILATAVPQDRPVQIETSWLRAGLNEQRRSGLPRALFRVRLLEAAEQGTVADRLSFLIGAFIGADQKALAGRKMLSGRQIVIVGHQPLAEAWRSVLAAAGIVSTVLAAADSERALLTGLGCLLRSRIGTRDWRRSIRRSVRAQQELGTIN
jgi:2-dehydro-3-deoxygalactonokinase